MASAGIVAGPLVNPANQHAYYLRSPSTRTESERQAVALGGHLVTINDSAECQWIFDKFCTFGGITRPIWIGLTDKDQEGRFVWINGETSSFRNWHPGEPNNNAGLGTPENYAFIFPARGDLGGWRDLNDQAISDLDDNPARWNVGPDQDLGCYGLVEVNVAPPMPPAPTLNPQPASESLKISWQLPGGTTGQLQSTADPAKNEWTDEGNLVIGTGGVVEISVPLKGTQRFYRVQMVR